MAEDPDIAIGRPGRSRRRALLGMAVGATGLVALLGGGLWLARKPIALHFIAQALRERNVAATYDIVRIGPRTQRLERLVLGNPAHPDLTAEWIEVDLGYSLSGVRVTGVRTGTVAVNARYHDGRLELGDLDKLMPKSGGEAALPDVAAEFKAVKLRLATDNGPVDFALNGVGNLRSGFAGDLGATARRLTFGDCVVNASAAQTKIATDGGKVQLKGPMTVREMACSGRRLALAAPRIEADLLTDLALSDITAAFVLSAARIQFGDRSATQLSGLVTAKGSSAELRGSASLAAARSALGIATTRAIKLGGDYALRPNPKDQDYSYAGTLTADEIRPTSQAAYGQIEAQAAGTPLEPLAKKFTASLRSASRANRLTASGRLSGEGPAMQLLLNGANFSAASGAHIALREGSRFTLDLPKGSWALDGALESGGGGLPETRLAVARRPDGGMSGRLEPFDYRAGPARLALTTVRFLRSARGDLRINTGMTLDGPIGTGGVTGLQAPIDVAIAANGTFRLPRDCVPVRWAALRIAAASFDPAKIDLCGIGGAQLRVASPALSGRIGESPLQVEAKDARFAVRSNRFDLTGLDARIGGGPNPVLLHAGTFGGTLGKGGNLGGTLADGTAVIGTVPLDLSAIAGAWTLEGGVLGLKGALVVADREAGKPDPQPDNPDQKKVGRFYPVAISDAKLRLADGRIDANGTLVATGTSQHRIRQPFGRVTIGHDLGTGRGEADFALEGLRFVKGAFGPEDLTVMTFGIVSDVEGAVTGSGTIRWSPDGVTSSSGTFSTRDMDFAGAFGPVKGFGTAIEFTDLLGLRTAPHQRMTVRQVSAGVDVYDGVIDYALQSSEQARIEGGRWPFSGGTLELLPATLHLDARQPRRLSFRVTGIDAGAFIQTMQLENISATGTFDGIFPMVFDEHGGRVEHGLLIARQAGNPALILNGPGDALPVCDPTRRAGSLAYVGAVSNAELGTMGKLAFDALKHLGYRCLSMDLTGALDGEFVTQVRINGVNLGSAEARQSFLTRPFLGLPFLFNIRIEAPFRGLLGTAASLADPSGLIKDEVDKQIRAGSERPLAVQPADSEKKIEGKPQ